MNAAFDATKHRPLHDEVAASAADEDRHVLEVSPNGHRARALRVAAALVVPPLIAIANNAVCSQPWYAVLLAYAPVAGGWIGLISRPVFDAVLEREGPRYEFSGKGAIAGSVAAFFAALLFAPKHADRSTLLALFVASALLYYAIGKGGCLFLGCCRASSGRAAAMPLPAIEAASAFVICTIALLAAVLTHSARMDLLAVICAAVLALRVYSRVARGARVGESLVKLDSIALALLVGGTAAAAFWQ